MKKNMQILPLTVLKWIKKMDAGEGFRYKMCENAFAPYCLDAITLAYDLKQMLGILLSVEEQKRCKAVLDEYQVGEEGFFYEKDYKKTLKDRNIERIEEMHGNYLTFQTLGAYKSIEQMPQRKITFYDQFIENKGIAHYLSNNCPWEKSPWGAGGMVDNLGTILQCNIDMGHTKYETVVDEIFCWLQKHQSKDTGLWGSTTSQGINGLVNGGYHLMRGTYFLYNRPFAYAEKIIDTIIQDVKENRIFDKKHAHGCQDMDHFYLLEKCHNQVPDYRSEEIRKIVTKRMEELFDLVYCKDGGFSFEAQNAVKEHNYYRVSPGEKESDMQGTVFYLQTIKSMRKIVGMELDINDSKTHG